MAVNLLCCRKRRMEMFRQGQDLEGSHRSKSLGLQGDQISQSWRKSVLNIHWKDWWWSWSFNSLATDAKNWLIWKDPDAGKNWRQEEKGTTEDEMVGWHHWFDGHEFEQALEDGEGQGGLLCCSPWGCRVGHDWTTKLLLKSSPKLLFCLHLFKSLVLNSYV